MPYKTVFNGCGIVRRKVQKTKKGLVIVQAPAAAESQEKIAPTVQAPVDKEKLRQRLRAEIFSSL